MLVESSFGGCPELLLVPSVGGGPEPSFFGGGILKGYVCLDGVCSACFGSVGLVLNMSSTILDLGFEVGLIVAEPEAAGPTGQSNASGGVSGLSAQLKLPLEVKLYLLPLEVKLPLEVFLVPLNGLSLEVAEVVALGLTTLLVGKEFFAVV